MRRHDNEDDQAFANRVCVKVAQDLDAGDRSSLDMAGKVFADLPINAFGLAFAFYIGLERALKHNLDEDTNELSKLFMKLGDYMVAHPDEREAFKKQKAKFREDLLAEKSLSQWKEANDTKQSELDELHTTVSHMQETFSHSPETVDLLDKIEKAVIGVSK